LKASALQLRFAQVSTLELGPAHEGQRGWIIRSGLDLHCHGEGGALEPRATKAGTLELGRTKVGGLEVGTVEVRALELSVNKAGTRELGAPKGGALEPRATKAGTLELGPLEVGAVKLSLFEVSALELGIGDWRRSALRGFERDWRSAGGEVTHAERGRREGRISGRAEAGARCGRGFGMPDAQKAARRR
jgi:hypothetical protein